MRPKIFPDNILWLLIYTENLRKLAIIFFFITAVMVKSLSTHCGYPVDTMIYSTVVVLRLDGKSIHRLFKTFDVENRFSFWESIVNRK